MAKNVDESKALIKEIKTMQYDLDKINNFSQKYVSQFKQTMERL